jgi:hypothetical protein
MYYSNGIVSGYFHPTIVHLKITLVDGTTKNLFSKTLILFELTTYESLGEMLIVDFSYPNVIVNRTSSWILMCEGG